MIFEGKINIFPVECRQTNFMKSHVGWHTLPGIYILENAPTPGGGGGKKYQPMSFGGKNMKRRREKGGNLKKKEERGKEKGRKGKENEDSESNRVK
jgi:hypothetical protein